MLNEAENTTDVNIVADAAIPTSILVENAYSSWKGMVTIKKIFGIILTFTFLIGAGSIYANVDSAANLSNWYENSFQKKSSELGAATATGIFKTLKNVNVFVVGTKDTIGSTIESFRDEQVKKVVAEIVDYQNDIESQIGTTVTELEKENFDDYAEKAKVEEDIEEDIENILEEVLSEQ
jgi:hypothetical protein